MPRPPRVQAAQTTLHLSTRGNRRALIVLDECNRRHGLTGHVFERRFHSELIERESHLPEACQYIVLNPVRAGICELPEEWPWSSHAAVLGLAEPPPFFSPARVLSYFHHDPDLAREAYRRFVLAGLQANRRPALV